MAPELLNTAMYTADGPPYSSKTDVYAFGVIVNELMTEQKPSIDHPATTTASSSSSSSAGVLTRYEPSIGDGSTGAAIRSVIDLCLETRGAKRPTFSELVTYLSDISTEVKKTVKSGGLNDLVLPKMERATRPTLLKLRDLTNSQVVALLTKSEAPSSVIDAVRSKEITGQQLSNINSVEDLQTLLGEEVKLVRIRLLALYDEVMELKGSSISFQRLLSS
jgi:serine/threonine protein kinase